MKGLKIIGDPLAFPIPVARRLDVFRPPRLICRQAGPVVFLRSLPGISLFKGAARRRREARPAQGFIFWQRLAHDDLSRRFTDPHIDAQPVRMQICCITPPDDKEPC